MYDRYTASCPYSDWWLPLNLGGPGRSTGASLSSPAPKSLQSPDSAGLLAHPSPLAQSYPSLVFFNLHPKPFCSLFSLPVYCCTSTFPSEDYTVHVHNHNQDYNADFCENTIIPHSGKVWEVREVSTQKKKRKSYWILNKTFIHNSEPLSSYWVAQLLSNLEMRVLTILRKTSNVESFSGKEEVLVVCLGQDLLLETRLLPPLL